MGDVNAEAARIREAITASGVSIYDSLVDRPELFYPTTVLAGWLDASLAGLNLDYPIRTRSKVLKEAVCAALGYQSPPSFKKVQPRFPGQNFDTYVQGSNNLQIWNEEVEATRRYVIIRVDQANTVKAVRVITGEELALLDRTGTLTSKYQAKIRVMPPADLLASIHDTDHVESLIGRGAPVTPIGALFSNLKEIVGTRFKNPGLNQERNRGAMLHALVRERLGGATDSGQFPDFPSELVEIKLQTSPTVDLGLVNPISTDPIAAVPSARHCDVRYAIFFGSVEGGMVLVERLVLVTGEDFSKHFQPFGGLIVNKKRQIPLPNDFFGH